MPKKTSLEGDKNNIKILADASLPELSAFFPAPFTLTLYQTQQELHDLLPFHDILLCRSTLRINEELLANSSIQSVATASSGTDHIDHEYLRQHNITLFDAKGSNARAVADYVVSTLAAHPPSGNLAGVIGVGEVGSRVVERLQAANFNVICFDPFKAQQDTQHHYVTLAELAACDLICLHANLHESAPFPSKHLLNTDFLMQLKSGVTIINASRGGIIDEEALLKTETTITYCTDVYCNEPSIDPRIIDFATICTPHIAGHTIEAKLAAIIQVSQQLHQYYGLTTTTIQAGLPYKGGDPSRKTTSQKTWQEHVLNIYNPMADTLKLKAAMDKQAAFLTQRKAHQHRHDFNCYGINEQDQQCKILLGL